MYHVFVYLKHIASAKHRLGSVWPFFLALYMFSGIDSSSSDLRLGPQQFLICIELRENGNSGTKKSAKRAVTLAVKILRGGLRARHARYGS